MSRPSIHITIPKPCHESWDAMHVTERGAFCQSCQKEVIDFSAMTDRELIEYLEKHQTGCGRFREDQLNVRLSFPKVYNGIFKWKALLLGILPVLAFRDMSAAPYKGIKTAQVFVAPSDEKDTSSTQSPDSIHIAGKVVDEKGGGMISATLVFVDSSGKSVGKGTVTDFDGNFSIDIDKYELGTNKYHTVRITYAGYESHTIHLSMASYQFYNIALSPDTRSVTMGLIVTLHLTPAQKIKYWFHRAFKVRHKH